MHSSQAAPQPQAPAAPASAPQLTFGSTPAPTSGPGTGIVTLWLLMHCIAADAVAVTPAAVVAAAAGGTVDAQHHFLAL